MQKSDVRLAAGLVVESVGEDLLILLPGARDVVRITGSAAEVVRALEAGNPIDSYAPSVSELKSLGIVSLGSGLSRRGLVRGSAVGLGAAVAVLAMPNVAAASSIGGGSGGGGSVINKTLVRGQSTGGDVAKFTALDIPGTGTATILEVLIAVSFQDLLANWSAARVGPTVEFTTTSPIAETLRVRIRFQFGDVEYLADTELVP